MKAVKGLDVKRYMGRWYEIACFPSRFQPRDGVNTRATYSLDDNDNDASTIRVLNETWSAGKRSFIQGVAYKSDPNSDLAALKVKFWVPPFLPLFPVVGDYWILHIDEDDYQYALVGQPSLRYLWILSRNPTLDDHLYSQLLDKATHFGYDVTKLVKTPHTHTHTHNDDDDQGPQDTKGFWWLKSIFQ